MENERKIGREAALQICHLGAELGRGSGTAKEWQATKPTAAMAARAWSSAAKSPRRRVRAWGMAAVARRGKGERGGLPRL